MANRIVAVTRSMALCPLFLWVVLAGELEAFGQQVSGRRASVRSLLDELHLDEPPGEQVLVKRIARIGCEALPELLDAWADQTSHASDRRVVVTVLRELPRRKVVASLSSAAAEGEETARRLAAVRLLALLGSAETLRSWGQLGEELVRELRMMPDRATDLVRSLALFLSSSDRSYDLLEGVLPELDESLLPLAVRAIGLAAQEEGLGILESVLDRNRALDVGLLPAFARICARHPGEAAEHALARLRRRLSSFEARVRESAILALGEARDPKSVPLFVERLEDEDSIVRHAALYALRQLGGPSHSTDPAVWRAWSDGEMRWRQQRFDALLLELARSDPTAQLRALSEFTLHPLHAHDIVAGLEPLVADSPSGITLVCVQVLAGLRCPSALRVLEFAAARSEPEIRQAAEEALRRLGEADELTVARGP